MNLRMVFLSLVAAAGICSIAAASDAPSKKQTADPAKVQPAPSQPKAAPVEPQAKREEPLKWDQINPKYLEQRAKAQQTPFAKLPVER